jgi:hypothetical protein
MIKLIIKIKMPKQQKTSLKIYKLVCSVKLMKKLNNINNLTMQTKMKKFNKKIILI